MGKAGEGCWPILLWWLSSPGVTAVFGLNATLDHSYQPPCKPGHYCSEGSETAVPCPRGRFAPSFWATDISGCIICPPHHYAPREGLAACRPCGPTAQQALPGQDKCQCLGEGQVFQASDGQCQCSPGYRSTQGGNACELKVYEICRDGRARDQYGECLDHKQWKQLCTYQVCASPELYEGFDASLGLCICKSHAGTDSGKSECSGWCEGSTTPMLQLVCSSATLQLLYNEANRQVSTSGSVLLSVLKHWDFQGKLECDRRLGFSRPVYAIQTAEGGFHGFLHALPAGVRMLVLETSQKGSGFAEASSTHSMAEVVFQENNTHMDPDSYWSTGSISRGAGTGRVTRVVNPIACLHPEDVLLFTVTRQHYPQYDVENLFNTNAAFDWGVFRVLAQELTMTRSAKSLFSISFSEPGVYVLRLSSDQHKQMYVKVLPSGGECYDVGPFFPTDVHHMIRMGITRRRHLMLRPDWWVIGGLLAGAAVVLCLCLLLLMLFRQYGWPEKLPAQVSYRTLQLMYNMDNYSSKGSRVMALKKFHQNLQAGMPDDTVLGAPVFQTITELWPKFLTLPVLLTAPVTVPSEFWDYEEQVDLEAFSSSTFYEILLKHSVTVTARLGKLREEVKQLYRGVLGKLWGLQLGCSTLTEDKLKCLERQVEQEITSRKVLGTQLTQLLDSQLQILRAELQPQHDMHKAFTAGLRECFWLLGLVSDNQASLWDKPIQQCAMDRVAVLAEKMAELVLVEAQRQGCWTLLQQGTGAQLLCPTSGVALSRDDLIAPDGTVRACDTIHVDPFTGLMQPMPNAHMLLASGHSMPVPSDFFLHPQTGLVLPIAGNVGFDPASSILVYTADACVGDLGKWVYPLLPFIPYPQSRHSELSVPAKLRALRPGQRLAFGEPMYDYETGVFVPILAVTIHPQTGMVYPVGGVYVCPVSRLRQPIQIGCPMLDPRTGIIVLITGVTLDSHTGVVLPVGGPLLGESFIEPLSGRMVRVGGGSLRGGKVVPHAGGFQALMDSHALWARMQTVELLRTCCEEWTSETLELHSEIGRLKAACLDLDQTWRISQHCMIQLLSRLEAQQEWACGLVKDGGSVGEIKLSAAQLSLPALPGLEYPDPGGSGLAVPVLGAQLDWVSGSMVPLAGTMEDADGKGLVPIRIGAQTVDPVSGDLASVVGARVDFWKRTVVPVTVSQCQILDKTSDIVVVEALRKECSKRAQFWRRQKAKEEQLVSDLESALRECLYTTLQEEPDHTGWSDTEKQLQEAAAELQEAARTEALRRSAEISELSLLLPEHVLLILTGGDEEEWNQQCHWHTELTAVLNRVGVFMAKQQWDREPPTTLVDDKLDKKTRQRELWEQLNQRRSELDVALTSVNWTRELNQLHADTAEAMLSGEFWYRDYGPLQLKGGKNPLKAMAMMQHRILPQLERLIQLLEESKHSTSTSSQDQQSSGKDWNTILQLSSLFQLIQEVEQQLRTQAQHAGLLSIQHQDSGRPFIDFLDAQWESEGELVQVSADTLGPREFLIYQHGQFLFKLLYTHKVAPAVKLLLASSLPRNNYHSNAFRNSFYYQETEETLYVRCQRLQSIGGFSLLLLHCAAHISTGQLSVDSTASFQRAFFRVLEVCLSELFHSRLSWDLADGETQSRDLVTHDLLLERVHKPDDVSRLLEKHKESSVFRRVESLLRERRLEVSPSDFELPIKRSTEGQDRAPE